MNKRSRKPKQEQQPERDDRPLYDDDVDLREFLTRMHNTEQFRSDFERSRDDE